MAARQDQGASCLVLKGLCLCRVGGRGQRWYRGPPPPFLLVLLPSTRPPRLFVHRTASLLLLLLLLLLLCMCLPLYGHTTVDLPVFAHPTCQSNNALVASRHSLTCHPKPCRTADLSKSFCCGLPCPAAAPCAPGPGSAGAAERGAPAAGVAGAAVRKEHRMAGASHAVGRVSRYCRCCRRYSSCCSCCCVRRCCVMVHRTPSMQGCPPGAYPGPWGALAITIHVTMAPCPGHPTCTWDWPAGWCTDGAPSHVQPVLLPVLGPVCSLCLLATQGPFGGCRPAPAHAFRACTARLRPCLRSPTTSRPAYAQPHTGQARPHRHGEPSARQQQQQQQ